MDIRKFFKGGGGAKKAAVKEEGVKRKQPVASAQSAAQKKPKQGATADAGRAAAKAADGTDDGNVVWKWINHTQPKSFDRALFPKLNAGWGGWKAGGSQTMSLTITQGAKKVSYTIDFEAMKQVNDETGYERTIKRVVSQPKPKSEPPRKQACSSDLDTFRAQGAASAAAASSGKAATKKASPSSKGKQGKAKIGVTTYTAEKKQPAQPKAKRASGGGGGGGGGAPWMSGPPPMLGMKNIPEGKPGCLKGKTFLVTGVLESLGRDDAFDLIRKYGGEVLKSVTKKKVLNYAIIGEGAGASKLKALDASKHDIERLDENGLLHLIRNSLDEPERSKQPEVGSLKEQELDIPTGAGAVGSAKGASKRPAAAAAAAPPPVAAAPRDTSADLWTEKYKPRKARDLVGNFQAAQKLSQWISKWSPVRGSGVRSVLLSGPPGIGKTSMAHCIVRDCGFDLLEFNASDVRSKKAVANQIQAVTGNRSMSEFFGGASSGTKKVALIMDEVDGMSSGDRGGMQELIKIIENSQVPIICCCNDDTHDKVRALKKHCLCLPFILPHVTEVKKRILEIAKIENMTISAEGIEKLHTGCNGDLRQMITSLQMWSHSGPGLSLSGANVAEMQKSQGKEILQVTIVDTTKKLMSYGPSMLDRMDAYWQNTDMAPLWVQEVYPKVANSIPCANRDQQLRALKFLSRAATSISDSDLVMKSIRGGGNWSLSPLYSMLSCAAPGVLLSSHCPVTCTPSFPLFLGQTSKGNKRARLLREMAMHTRSSLAGGAMGLRMDYFEPLRQRLTAPLRNRGIGGVDEVMELLDSLNMSKDDWDTLVGEFGLGASKELDKRIDGRVRGAFTRTYNKTHKETQKIKKGRDEASTTGGMSVAGGDDEDEDEEEEEEEEEAQAAAMFKKSKRKAGGGAAGGKKKKKQQKKKK